MKLVRDIAVDGVACDEVANGVRDELARGGALEAGDGYPRVEIEVLRSTTGSEGIADVGGKPLARATDVGLTARAWVIMAEGTVRRWDTGDVRATETVAVDDGLGGAAERGDFFHLPDARRAAARNLGRMLARRLLGLPAVSTP